ncbi:hypothetical protein BH09PSE1_BH09PSE1_04460 [soil metagenome]
MSKPLFVMMTVLATGTFVAPGPVAATIALATTTQPTPLQSRDGQNRRVRIHNQTGWTMVRFQVADAGSRVWRDDPPGFRPIATGASWVAAVDDGSGGCVYGFRAEFSNGQTLERTPINVCEIADYYFTR